MSAVGYEIRDQKEPVAGASESDVLEEQRSRRKSSRWCHGLVERITALSTGMRWTTREWRESGEGKAKLSKYPRKNACFHVRMLQQHTVYLDDASVSMRD